VKVGTVLVFIGVAALYLFGHPDVATANWHPFIPPNTGEFGHFGWSGIARGAAVIFFAYIGFDAVSTAAQEAKNPQKDMPLGILGSLAICTVLYIAVSLILTGTLNYTQLDGPSPLAKAVEHTGMLWLNIIVNIGAIAGLTSVMLVLLMGQPRIFYAMAEDGLFPEIATRVHPKYKTPWVTTLITGIVVSVLAGFLPIDVLAEMTSIGTLFAFFLVNIGIIILRHTQPDAERRFKVPLGPYVLPIIGAIFCVGLVATATIASIERLFIWMAIGLVIYAAYGRRKSRLNNPHLERHQRTLEKLEFMEGH